MEVTLRTMTGDRDIEVREGQSVAVAAEAVGIRLLGPCDGMGMCGSCIRRVVSGIGSLLSVETGRPYAETKGYDLRDARRQRGMEFARTCAVHPLNETVIFDLTETVLPW
jgi:ferredoxin